LELAWDHKKQYIILTSNSELHIIVSYQLGLIHINTLG